jgi:hypothetical protein
MIQSTDFRLRSVQAVGFFSGGGVRPALMLRRVPEDWLDLYSADPIALPTLPDAPEGLPGVILQSRDQSRTAAIAPARIDLVENCGSADNANVADILQVLSERLATFSECSKTTYGRLAAVVARIAEQRDPGLALARQFCRDEWLRQPLNRPDGFELHAHRVFDLQESVPVNSWIRIKTVKVGPGPYDQVLVEQDINTLQEKQLEGASFDNASMAVWFREVSKQFETVLAMYFPPAQAGAGV